jgi:hypothetical protein
VALGPEPGFVGDACVLQLMGRLVGGDVHVGRATGEVRHAAVGERHGAERVAAVRIEHARERSWRGHRPLDLGSVARFGQRAETALVLVG